MIYRMPVLRVVTACFLIIAAGDRPLCAADDARAREPSFPISAEAKAFVDRFDRTELVKDEVFVKVLLELARSELSAEAKADAFASCRSESAGCSSAPPGFFPIRAMPRQSPRF